MVEMFAPFKLFTYLVAIKKINMFILGTIGIVAIIIGVMALMSDEKPKPKAKSKKKRKRTVWDDDPFYGTPLQKIK